MAEIKCKNGKLPKNLNKMKCENNVRSNCRLDDIDTEKRLPNLIIAGLPNRYQCIPGVCEFAANEMGILNESDIACMYVIVETNTKTMFLIRFTNQRARNNFYLSYLD